MIKPVIQTKLQKEPPLGVNGNCFAACVATLLCIPIEEVPPFEEYMEDRTWVRMATRFLASHGYVWGTMDDPEPGEYYVALGYTVRSDTVLHAVIYKDGEMVHDPHPDKSGILAPLHLEFFEKLPHES